MPNDQRILLRGGKLGEFTGAVVCTKPTLLSLTFSPLPAIPNQVLIVCLVVSALHMVSDGVSLADGGTIDSSSSNVTRLTTTFTAATALTSSNASSRSSFGGPGVSLSPAEQQPQPEAGVQSPTRGALPSSEPSSSPRRVFRFRLCSSPAFVVLSSPREVQCGYEKKKKNTTKITKTGLAVALPTVQVKKCCGYKNRGGGGMKEEEEEELVWYSAGVMAFVLSCCCCSHLCPRSTDVVNSANCSRSGSLAVCMRHRQRVGRTPSRSRSTATIILLIAWLIVMPCPTLAAPCVKGSYSTTGNPPCLPCPDPMNTTAAEGSN